MKLDNLLGRGAFEDSVGAGAVLCFDVSVLRVSASSGLVGLVQRDDDLDLYMSLTPPQARQLAAWLRLAAAPGRTINVAKANLRRAAARTER